MIPPGPGAESFVESQQRQGSSANYRKASRLCADNDLSLNYD